MSPHRETGTCTRRPGRLVFRSRDSVPHPFHLGAPTLGLQTPFSRGARGSGATPLLGLLCRPADQRDQSIDRLLPIPCLCAMLAGFDDQDAVLTHPSACQASEPFSYTLRQRRRVAHVEAELDSSGDLVDILSARSRSVDKVQHDFALIDCQGRCDVNHSSTIVEQNLPAVNRTAGGSLAAWGVRLLTARWFCSKMRPSAGSTI